MPKRCDKPSWETVNNVTHRCERQYNEDGTAHAGDCRCECGKTKSQ